MWFETGLNGLGPDIIHEHDLYATRYLSRPTTVMRRLLKMLAQICKMNFSHTTLSQLRAWQAVGAA